MEFRKMGRRDESGTLKRIKDNIALSLKNLSASKDPKILLGNEIYDCFVKLGIDMNNANFLNDFEEGKYDNQLNICIANIEEGAKGLSGNENYDVVPSSTTAIPGPKTGAEIGVFDSRYNSEGLSNVKYPMLKNWPIGGKSRKLRNKKHRKTTKASKRKSKRKHPKRKSKQTKSKQTKSKQTKSKQTKCKK